MACASTTTRRWWGAERERRAPIIHGGWQEFSATKRSRAVQEWPPPRRIDSHERDIRQDPGLLHPVRPAYSDPAGTDGGRRGPGAVERGGERGRHGLVRRAADETRGDRRLGLGSALQEQRRLPAQHLDSRSGA